MGRGKLNAEVTEGSMTDINRRAFEYKTSGGSTKSLHMHLLAKHIESPEDEGEDSASEALSNNHSQPVPLGDVQDRDQFLNSNTAKQYAPRAAYQSFLKRKQRANGGKGFDERHFRKKVIQW
jgi:hypothetical protein